MKVLSAITLAALGALGTEATSVERRASGSVPVTIQVHNKFPGIYLFSKCE